MSDSKRFYWIKLKTNFFDETTTDWLLSQKNGCQYVVLYLMLCLKTANSDGLLATNIGEMLVPYDVEKIMRDTKYFDFDTVTVGLELFKKLGLVYVEENNMMRIANSENMVGSETSSAKAMREWRNKKKLQCKSQCDNNVIQEYRDKSIEYRDKNIDIYKDETQALPKQKEEDTLPYKEIVDYLNLKAGTKYKASTPKTKECIHARWSEGFRLDDFKSVIEKMSDKWLGTEYEEYLRPVTLFGTKFESYLNSKVSSKKELPDWYYETQQTKPDDSLLKKALELQKKMGA